MPILPLCDVCTLTGTRLAKIVPDAPTVKYAQSCTVNHMVRKGESKANKNGENRKRNMAHTCMIIEPIESYNIQGKNLLTDALVIK